MIETVRAIVRTLARYHHNVEYRGKRERESERERERERERDREKEREKLQNGNV